MEGIVTGVEIRVVEGVVTDLVAELAEKAEVAGIGPFAEDEEGGGDSFCGEEFCDVWRCVGHWAVVERQTKLTIAESEVVSIEEFSREQSPLPDEFWTTSAGAGASLSRQKRDSLRAPGAPPNFRFREFRMRSLFGACC